MDPAVTRNLSAANRRSKASPFEACLKLLKEGLVLQLVRRQGEFWEAAEKIRVYWQIDDPLAQLPPETDNILLTPSLDEEDHFSAARG